MSISDASCGCSPQEQQRKIYESRLRPGTGMALVRNRLIWTWTSSFFLTAVCGGGKKKEKNLKTKGVVSGRKFHPGKHGHWFLQEVALFSEVISHIFFCDLYRYHTWKFSKIVFSENQEFGMRWRWSYLDTKLDMASIPTHTSELGGTPKFNNTNTGSTSHTCHQDLSLIRQVLLELILYIQIGALPQRDTCVCINVSGCEIVAVRISNEVVPAWHLWWGTGFGSWADGM